MSVVEALRRLERVPSGETDTGILVREGVPRPRPNRKTSSQPLGGTRYLPVALVVGIQFESDRLVDV